MFVLDDRLAKDALVVGSFPLCLLLMSRDANYPWFILVPRREQLTELYHLDEGDAAQLARESRHLSRVLMEVFRGDKLNVAALGNMVPQLHIHHIVRYRSDPAWPGPVWGAVAPVEFGGEEAARRAALVLDHLGEGFRPGG